MNAAAAAAVCSYFYDVQTGNYTVQRYLADLRTRYGGVDSMLIWPTYPLTGVDDRSSWQLIEALPGGLPALRQVVAELHAAGVRVLWAYLFWDEGTAPDPLNRTDPARMAALLTETGADGFNADSMLDVPRPFWAATGAVMEPEGGGSAQTMSWDTMGWGYWGQDPYTGGGGGTWPTAPLVDKWKWFEPRRMTNVCDRWNRNKTDNLQAAYFNGVGYESWENVWQMWNGITERDGEAIRRVATILRFFGSRGGFLDSIDWVPHTPALVRRGGAAAAVVFASEWPKAATGETLWTLVNRGSRRLAGGHIELLAPRFRGARFFDCYAGGELAPAISGSNGTTLVLSFPLEAAGYGCVLATPNASTAAASGLTPLHAFLAAMRAMTNTPLATYNSTWTYLQQRRDI